MTLGFRIFRSIGKYRVVDPLYGEWIAAVDAG